MFFHYCVSIGHRFPSGICSDTSFTHPNKDCNKPYWSRFE